MSLKGRLEAARIACEANADPAAAAATRVLVRGLREAGVAADAVKAGDIAPEFAGADQLGARVALSGLLRRGPAVISFFRGYWCAFCALELQALAEIHAEIKRLGATLVALSPYSGSMPRCIGEAIIPFPVLHDAGCAIASRYGVAFSIPAELRALHLALGFPKPARDSPTSWKLPIPATYIVGITGRVVLSYLDVDYTTRLAPADIIAAMTHLQAKSVSDHSPPSDRQ